MNTISTHVLDTVLGRPAAGVRLSLEMRTGQTWVTVGQGITDVNGRCQDLAPNPQKATYRLAFQTGDYLKQQGRSSLYPEVSITFVTTEDAHYHLPLLLSDNCYTTYRGS